MNAQLRRDVLQAMGIEPMVLRSRAPVVLQPTSEPPSSTSAPVASVPVFEPKPAPPKIEVQPQAEPQPQVPKAVEAVVPAWPTLHFAVVQAGDVLLVAQLPAWARGLIEANCGGFLKDLLVYLPSGGKPEEVMGLPKQVTPTAEDYQGMLTGRLMRAGVQGAKRLLLLSDHDELEMAVPPQWALYKAPSLTKIMDDAEHKQALWATVQTLRS